MNRKVLTSGVASGILALAIAGYAVADRGAQTAETPARADNFRLVDHTGFAQEMRRLHDAKAIVVVSQVNGDAGSRAAAKKLEALKAAHPGVEFLMLNSSLDDDRAEIAAEAASQGYTIPVMDDEVQLVGEQLGVSYAGEAFVLEPRTLNVLYHGPVDASGAQKKAEGYLGEALADIEAGRAIQVSAVEGKGSAIRFPERTRTEAHANISYADEIAPILEEKCVVCHQPGGIGPFAMTNYEVIKGFAPMIRESIRTDTMPPWHPDPTIGKFSVDYGLSNEQTRKLVHWIEAGAPRGDGADPLAAVEHVAPEWPLGEPDLVLEIPAYDLPAAGVVEYQYPYTHNELTEGRWVRAATLMPGDRQGVHHILAGYMSEAPDHDRPTSGSWEASYGEYAVGGESFTVPDNIGVYLPPGGVMSFQMHYTPYGKEAVDNSKMGLYFYPEGHTPELVMRHSVIADTNIELPANTDRHEEIAYANFPNDAVLYSVFLHTHYRGQAAKFEMIKPDGERETLINLPRYDFSWQRTYEFAEPIDVPAGSKLVATYLYDNSVRNPGNPDPNEVVRWGDQSWEEMHYTSIYYHWKDETAVNQLADAEERLNNGRLMGMLDDSLDGKLQLAELSGSMGSRLAPRFAALDADSDGGLDAAELAPLAGMMRFGGD